MYGLAAFVGAAAGFGAVLFDYLSSFLVHSVLVRGVGYAPVGPKGEPHLFSSPGRESLWIVGLLCAPALGGFLSSLLCRRYAPEAGGHGTDAAIDAYHRHGGEIRGRVPLVKALATALCLGFGGSGGREGPIAQIGAGVGSLLGRSLRLSRRQRRILLAAGMGAGVGSIFKAPLAGALFSAEILYREAEFESDVVMPSFIACSVAYCVFCGWMQDFGTLFQLASPLQFTALAELLPYTVLALLLVPAVYLNIKVFYGAEKVFAALPGPRPLIAAFGGLLCGLLALGLYGVLDDERGLAVLSYGYGLLQEGLDGSIVGWGGARLLGLVALLKILSTACTISSGGSGGVFGPSMVIGGALGGAVGIAGHELGLVAHPECFIIVGMCGFFSGAARTPISTIIMVSEMTGSYELLLPAMWVCAICFTACSRVTLYEKQVPNRAHSDAHRGEFMVPLLDGLRVRDVFVAERPFVSVPQAMPLKEVLKQVADCHADYFPVLDGERMVGIFSAHDVRSYTYDETLHELAVAADLMTTDVLSVTLDEPLHQALEQFNRKNIDELPVVSDRDRGELIGMLRRREITRAYKERLAAIQREDD